MMGIQCVLWNLFTTHFNAPRWTRLVPSLPGMMRCRGGPDSPPPYLVRCDVEVDYKWVDNLSDCMADMQGQYGQEYFQILRF